MSIESFGTKDFRRLNHGDYGFEVFCLQKTLVEMHYLPSDFVCNGVYGPKTTGAVTEFQNKYNDYFYTAGEYEPTEFDAIGVFNHATYNALIYVYKNGINLDLLSQ